MKEKVIKGLYDSIVEENLKIYKEIYENTEMESVTDQRFKESLNLYNSLSDDNRKVFFNFIEQITIDSISNILGIIDGSSSINENDMEFKLSINDIEIESDLQDEFLRYIEFKNQ